MAPRPDTSEEPAVANLREELGKAHGFDSLEQRVHLALLRTSSLSESPLLKVFRDHDLSMSAYNVLRILRGSGDTGRRATEIAPGMVVRVPDVTRILDRLESAGLVRRESDPSDRRRVVVKITQRGQTMLKNVERKVMAAHDTVLDALTTEELTTLDRTLAKIRAVLTSAEND